MAEYFLDFNRERDGGAEGDPRLRSYGRPKKLSEVDIVAGRALLTAGTISVADIAKRLGVDRDTFYRYFPRARASSIAAKS